MTDHIRLTSIADACVAESCSVISARTLHLVETLLHQVRAVRCGDEVIGVVYRDEPTRGWFAANFDDLEMLLRRIADGEADAYSLWCSDIYAREHDSAEQAAASLA
jgi:hypothetical protein